MIGNALKIIQWLYNQDKNKLYDIKEYKEKRTLTQNAYYWVLVNEIANHLKLSKEEVHFNMLQNYSQVALITIKSDIDVKGYIKYYELQRESIISGVKFKIYKKYTREVLK